MPISLAPDIQDLLILHLVPGLGPRLTTALLQRFGSARAVLQARPEELCEVPYIGAKLSQGLHQAMQTLDVARELELIDKFDVQLLSLANNDYPDSLKNISDPPHLLYMRGQWQAKDANSVALVGSRQCTSYGRRIAERLAIGLVQAGFTVVSGLARGIDAVAHRAALKAGGRTVAVLAGGLAKIYPPEHADLALEVLPSGALFSESSMQMEPMAGMFPARNRLISGLVRGVVVVEAAERSGALITARHAAEQGRAIFAVPGPVDSAASSGTLHLLREGATLIRGVEDILEELDGIQSPGVTPHTETPPNLDETQQSIWNFLAEQPRHIDEVTQKCSLSIPQAATALMGLEFKKAVRRLPGNRYERR